MNHFQNTNNLGDQFMSAVSDALNKGDFKQLNSLVTDTVSDAIADASVQFQKASDLAKKEVHTTSRTYYAQQLQRYKNLNAGNLRSGKQQLMPIKKTKSIGRISSVLNTTLGGIMTTFSTIWTLFAIRAMNIVDLVISLPLLAVFGIVLGNGIIQKKRLERMKRYIALCDDNMYVNISELAEQTHKSTQYVLKDVKKMLQLGFFPEGHLDKDGTCLMLDHATYQEYLQLEQQRNYLAAEEATQKEEFSSPEELQKQQLTAILQEGQEYIQKLHYLNDLIEDELVSEKLYQMEKLLREIFARLQDDPEQMPKIRKLMSYYLPTTIKLLESYSKFDDVSVPNEDIISAKTEIEKTIDIINEAFAELLNKLFQTSAFDAATDAQVLQTMLAKEGLTKNKMMEDK